MIQGYRRVIAGNDGLADKRIRVPVIQISRISWQPET